jgi:hypothetical protein
MHCHVRAGLALILGLIAVNSTSASAQNRYRSPRVIYKYYAAPTVMYYAAPEPKFYLPNPNAQPSWYPHNANVLPFGSRIWWDQKARQDSFQ